MLRVEMPRKSWDDLLFMLSLLDTEHIPSAEIDIMYADISTQIYSQESQ